MNLQRCVLSTPKPAKKCPVGVQGEMCNRGYNNMKGYYNNPAATAEIIDKDGFLHSGDLGVKDENGFYRITGRIKDMIIRGGENVYPREIEEYLYHLEGVKDVQVAAVPSKKYGEEVGAFIILHEGVTMTEDVVKRLLPWQDSPPQDSEIYLLCRYLPDDR